MRKIREVLRLHFELGCTHRQIAAACSVSPATVSDYLTRALRAGLGWQQAQPLSEAEVEAKLFVHIGRSEMLHQSAKSERKAQTDMNRAVLDGFAAPAAAKYAAFRPTRVQSSNRVGIP